MDQTELLPKTAKWRRSEANASETSREYTRNAKTDIFLHFWILSDFLMQNSQQEKHLRKVVFFH